MAFGGRLPQGRARGSEVGDRRLRNEPELARNSRNSWPRYGNWVIASLRAIAPGNVRTRRSRAEQSSVSCRMESQLSWMRAMW